MTRKINFQNLPPKMDQTTYWTFDPSSLPLREEISRGCCCPGSVLKSKGIKHIDGDWLHIIGFRVAIPRSVMENTWFTSDACDLVSQDTFVGQNPSYTWIPDNRPIKNLPTAEHEAVMSLGQSLICNSAILNRVYDIVRSNISIEFSIDVTVPKTALENIYFHDQAKSVDQGDTLP